jgi:hypothetical protein
VIVTSCGYSTSNRTVLVLNRCPSRPAVRPRAVGRRCSGLPMPIAGRSLRACGFRAIAAVPASAPAYGRRTQSGSQHPALRSLDASSRFAGHRSAAGGLVVAARRKQRRLSGTGSPSLISRSTGFQPVPKPTGRKAAGVPVAIGLASSRPAIRRCRLATCTRTPPAFPQVTNLRLRGRGYHPAAPRQGWPRLRSPGSVRPTRRRQ